MTAFNGSGRDRFGGKRATLTSRQDLGRWIAFVRRRYRRRTPGLVEKALDLNPWLADLGPYLRIGTIIRVPFDQPRSVQSMPLIKWWTDAMTADTICIIGVGGNNISAAVVRVTTRTNRGRR